MRSDWRICAIVNGARVVCGTGGGADRVGVGDDERVGEPLERVEKRSIHRRGDRRHGGNIDDAFPQTAEDVA